MESCNQFAIKASARHSAVLRTVILAGSLGLAFNASAAVSPAAAYGQLPIRFEPNVGQAAAPVKYLAHEAGYSVALTEQGAVLGLGHDSASRATLKLSLDGAAANPQMKAERQQASVSNYFVGNDSSKWHSDVANFGAVRYQQVYPGIDWVVYGNPQQLEYDLVVAPNADPRQVKLHIDGADRLVLDTNGDLIVEARGQTLRQLKPVVYQTAANGERQSVDSHYVLDQGQLTVALGDYDRSRELVIDPSFAYSTYIGGSMTGDVTSVAVDASGNAYLFGNTSSSDFPLVNPLQATNVNAEGSTFIAKMNASGSALVYSTYFGGSGDNQASAIAVDSSGNVYVAGKTSSTDFPTLNAFQGINKEFQNSYTGFVAKLNSTGSKLLYSTYLGGSGNPSSYDQGDEITALAVDKSGDAYVGGYTDSADFPTKTPFQATNNANVNQYGVRNTNGFVTKLSTTGSSLVYSSYLGGSGSQGKSWEQMGDQVWGLTIDASGNAYAVGSTSSLDFPIVSAYQSTNKAVNAGAPMTGFVSKISSTGKSLTFSTFLGGTGGTAQYGDSVRAVAVDSSNNVYVTGVVASTDFPTVNAYQRTNKTSTQGYTGFVTKLASTGRSLSYSTYLGGSGGNGTAGYTVVMGDYAFGIAVNNSGNAYVTGRTSSQDFPVSHAIQSVNNAAALGGNNAFVTELSTTGSTLVYSTYLGGSNTVPPKMHTLHSDWGNGIAVDSSGNAYVVGTTGSSNFPTYNAYQSTNPTASGTSGVTQTGFVTKIKP